MITASTKDQTPKAAIGLTGLGTAMFCVPSFASGKLEPVIQALKDVTYEQAKQFGEPCISFKWVPHEMAAI